MAENEEEVIKAPTISKRKKEPPPFVEVICSRTQKRWRFAAGTEAKFAVKIITAKLDSRFPPPPGGIHIEAVKEGEDPVIFGPNSVLVDYGDGWSLQTSGDSDGFGRAKQDNASATAGQGDYKFTKRTPQASSRTVYFGKILLAFIFIFFLGGVLAFLLESLPKIVENHLQRNETS